MATGEGLKGDPRSGPPPLFFLLSPDPFITEEPQFFNGPGGWRQHSSLSSLVQAHSPSRDLAHGWAWLGGPQVVPVVHARLCT